MVKLLKLHDKKPKNIKCKHVGSGERLTSRKSSRGFFEARVVSVCVGVGTAGARVEKIPLLYECSR